MWIRYEVKSVPTDQLRDPWEGYAMIKGHLGIDFIDEQLLDELRKRADAGPNHFRLPN